MTWEETIKYIRKLPEYFQLVEQAYFEEDLELNISRFRSSREYLETLKVFKKYAPKAKRILDIGCGNGISAINFAKDGYSVVAVEPDTSKTVGAGAIKILKDQYKLDTIDIFQEYAEHLNFTDNSFDIVYIRQAMHHAKNLDEFIKESVRVLKKGGLLLTIRDHVITDKKDKQRFLKDHPLNKFYGGENAYSASEYKSAISKAGATIIKELKYFDSEINYFPTTSKELNIEKNKNIKKQKSKLRKKLGFLANLPFVWTMYKKLYNFEPLNEMNVPGRMYSYIAIKK